MSDGRRPWPGCAARRPSAIGENARVAAPDLLVTTVVGSYPQPGWLIDRERLGERLPPRVRARELWRVPEAFLEEAQDDATRLAVRDMERAGVDVITDGEMRRESYSNRFATALDGVDLETPGVALDRTGHENPVPRVVGPIRRTRPVEVRDVEFLRSITDRRIKITVPGPFTMTQQAQNDHYPDERSLALAYAEVVNDELHDLKAAGADVVQIDEPYLQARPEPARAYAIEAIDRALEGIDGDTVLHTCFGYAHVVHDRLTGYPFLRELERVHRDACVDRGRAARARPRGAARAPGQGRRAGSARPGLGRGGDTRGRRRADSARAGRRPTRAARRRARLRDEVPLARAGVRQAGGDGRRCAARPKGSHVSVTSPSDTPVSRIGQAYPDRVEVRGRDLCGDLMGRLGFTAYFHLLLTGREPTDDEQFFLDLLLVSIAEHGLMPSNVAARMTLAADPESLHGAVAAGILGAGPVVLGTSGECARLLEEAQRRVAAGATPETAAAELAIEIQAEGGRAPGFGHPVHRPVDPRAERILELADARAVSGPHVLLARCLRDAVAETWGKPLPMNVSMPIAAVMLDLGYSPAAVQAVPILARTAGLLAHLAEEREHPIGFQLAAAAEDAVAYEPPAE